MTKRTTKEPLSTLQRTTYREQQNLRCCGTCRHAWYEDAKLVNMYCRLVAKRVVVEKTAVCDAYEQVTP